MDDEIDIEEHDILEHPQVKAAFPDLSKIQIQAHTEASFLDEASTHLGEFESLLEERQDYDANDFEDETEDNDLSKTAQEEENGLKETLEEAVSEENEAMETHEISDGECVDEAPHTNLLNDNLGVAEELSSKLHNLENKVDEINISEDEYIDKIQYHSTNKLIETEEEMAIIEATEEFSDIAKSTIEDTNYDSNILVPNSVDNVHEISDDETEHQLLTSETAELVENVDELFEEDTEKVDEVLANGDNNTEETLANGIEYAKNENVETEPFTAENQENECIDEDEDFEDSYSKANDNEVRLEFSEIASNIDEYQQVPIKEEIDFELENLSDFEETLPEETRNNSELPPEDIYHFNNKIILGSKPSPRDLDTCTKILAVLLEDWDVHLSRSQSYCNDCKTLFTTPNALDAHRMIAHSLLAPITNRAVKSTAKSSVNFAQINTVQIKNIAKKSTGLGNRAISSSTYCNHCNKTFKDHTTLIKHLYNLLPVKQYSCNFCDATFLNQNDLIKHNSIHIKTEPRKILKAKACSNNPILRQMLSKDAKPVSKAVKRSHPRETIAISKAVKIEAISVKEEPNVALKWYKCKICSDIFEFYGQARKHRYTHPEFKGQFILQKIPPKISKPNSKDKLIYEDDKSHIKTAKNKTSEAYSCKQFLDVNEVKTDKPFELIPKSALFQCSKCGLHFTSCVAGAAHVIGCDSTKKNAWPCPSCKKTLRKKDKNYHRKQHELSNKFKIYKITKNTYERTLCKCLKCNVHFEYNVLSKHITKCGKIPTAMCKKCNILIPKYRFEEHNKRHDVIKLKPKDFILVDYAVVNDKNKNVVSNKNNKTLDRKPILQNTMLKNDKIELEPEITIKTEPGLFHSKILNKLKFEKDKVKLYYCKHCKCYLMRSFARSIKMHLSRKCKDRHIYTSNCEICGLRMFRKARLSHARLHQKKNMTLNDIEFYDYATLKPITPAIPKYPSCNKCHIHFLNRKYINNHICGEDYEDCEVCGDKFENSALNLHLQFHQLLSSKPKPVPSRPEGPKMMPELMMKYESLNAIWNILFICGQCELVTDLYNKAVEHSQAHLKNDYCPNTIKCYICNMKFDETCWSKHSELHSRMMLNNKDFKMLKYTPKNLLDESWFQMFESLPEKEIRQIIDRSVFGSERSLKMKLIKDGLPEFTVYCCSICQVAYDNNDIRNHVKSKCSLPEHVCTVCDIAFDASSTLNFHELLHKKGIKKDEFRIVNFVKVDETIKQNKVTNAKETVASKKPSLKVKKTSIQKKGAQFVFYKCEECSACVMVSKSQSFHKCTPDHCQDYCRLCKQNFTKNQIGNHKVKHKTLPDLRAKNIKIVTFKPVKNASKKINKPKKVLARSESSDSDSQHSSVIKPSTSSNIKHRKTLNSSKHNRAASVASSDTDLEDKKTAKVYKCDCGLHFTSLRTIEKHIETCDTNDDTSKENCSKCGLLFPTDLLVSHLCKHHSKKTKITVEVVHKKSEVSTTQRKVSTTALDTTKLYKCGDCNVYFLNQNSCYKHVIKHERLDPKQYIECKMCCLQFRILSLHIHMKKHHEREFNLEKVLVEEYQPSASVKKGAPRIDIYFANEKIQNVQVSSSND